MKIGITGQAGFVGSYLFNLIGTKDGFDRVAFEDEYFADKNELRAFVSKCDVIVHLAAMNRHEDEQVIYDTNLKLIIDLINAMEDEKVTPHVLFSSSTQEERDNLYGKSKHEGRVLFEKWASKNGARFTGLVIPNVFGPFGKPHYNSFIATFCHQLNNNENPEIKVDGLVKLIYVGSLCEFILSESVKTENKIVKIQVPHDFEKKVSEVLNKLQNYKDLYIEQGIVPKLEDVHDVNLFNTLSCYMNFQKRYPYNLEKHSDDRGDFVEVIKLGVGGQVSFSTTKPNVTRGNHFHTRKIERFAVIKGKARIELRRIGSDEKLIFVLNGEKPSYVDMPIWYTHNITNTGNEDLYTQFWINEWFNPGDTDTFFETV